MKTQATRASPPPRPKSRNYMALVLIALLVVSNLVAFLLHVRLFLLQPSKPTTSLPRQQQHLVIEEQNDETNTTHLPKNGRHFQRRTRRKRDEGAQTPPFRLLPHHRLQQLKNHRRRHHHEQQQQQHNQQQPVIRYDAVAEAMEDCGAYGVVHQLPCIPDRRRMILAGGGDRDDRSNDNNNKIHNLTYFLEARLRPHERDRPLYIYNPMILPLNDKILEYDSILNDLGLNPGQKDGYHYGKASYIAVYRVSNFGNCHGPGRGAPDTYRNYLGIALLDVDLNIVPRHIDADDDHDYHQYLDIVIDLNRHLSDIEWSPMTPKGRGSNHHHHHHRTVEDEDTPVRQYMQDCQLVAVPSSSSSGGVAVGRTKADRLVLICNNYAMEVRLERASSAASTSTNQNEAAVSIANAYGSGLQLTLLSLPRTIVRGGKNLHYFRATDDGKVKTNNGSHGKEEEGGRRGGGGEASGGEGYLEIWPGGPHETMRIDFADRDRNNHNHHVHNVLMKSNRSEPDASFLTVDGIDAKSPLIARDSGSACCISVTWRDESDDDDIERASERRLLLGFSHRKTRRGLGKDNPPYNYVSRVYAFEPTPPFDIVARSGYFCLGFALKKQEHHHHHKQNSLDNDEAIQSDNEQVWGAANEYKLTINGIVFENCPAIHFVTGIAEKLGDEERTAIISYGVNDCYPRMVEVSKTFLVSLLRPLSSTR